MLEELRETVETVTQCRICNASELISRIDLGFTPIAYRLLSEEQLDEPEPYYPLAVAQCADCGLVQLEHKVDPRLLYPSDYPYDMDTTESAVSHFHGLAADAAEAVEMDDGDLAVDIGSSTGVLLQGFKNEGADVLGVEPADQMADRARSNGIETISKFFNTELANEIREEYGPAKVVTATNVINQIDDLQNFISGIDTLLAPDGLFVFETPHLLHTVEDLHYDHIYHEHSTYLSIEPIKTLIEQQDMCLPQIEEVDFRGGSLRCYVGRKREFTQTSEVDEIQEKENEADLYDEKTWVEFADQVKQHRQELNHLIYSINDRDESIAAISVTAKGNSMLNYCGLSKHDFVFSTEIMDTKLGKYTPGGHIPIVHDDKLLEESPDYALIMAWNFADTIIDNLDEYREQGGKFIVPMPEPTVIE